MPLETTLSEARAKLSAYCDQVALTREPLIIHRRGAEDVALVSASELRGLLETAHLLRSPENARRLLSALERARNSNDLPVETVETIRKEFDLGEAG